MRRRYARTRLLFMSNRTETTALVNSTLCEAAATGDGYWTCDTVGGCEDCRVLARQAEDDDTLEEWDALFRQLGRR